MTYEYLLGEAAQLRVHTFEKPMPHKTKGLYSDNVIWINKHIKTSTEKACILAEELGHFHTTEGNILNQTSLVNKKQEKQARTWAYKKLIPLKGIINAYKAGVNGRHELAEYLNVTEPFLLEALNRYKEEYGIYTSIDQYVIYFEPLSVLEMFNE